MDKIFKECTTCFKIWRDRNSFLVDPDVCMNGYQVNFGDLNAGFFLFTHNTPDCGSTIAIEAGDFVDLHDGPIFSDTPKEDAEDCPGYCTDNVLEKCSAKCECAYVTDVVEKVRKWPKQECSD